MSIARKGHTCLESSSGRDPFGRVPEADGNVSLRMSETIAGTDPRINDIVLERRGVTADAAICLSRFFRTTEPFWLNLQGAYEVSRVKAERSAALECIEPLKSGESRV